MAGGRPKGTPLGADEAEFMNATPVRTARDMSRTRLMKREQDVKRLIDLGKEKGYVTYDQVNDMLSPDAVSPEQLDDVMSIFGEMDIEVVDANQRVALSAQAEEGASDRAGRRRSRVRGGGGRGRCRQDRRAGSHLPSRDGNVSLLSRDGAGWRIAKKIEQERAW